MVGFRLVTIEGLELDRRDGKLDGLMVGFKDGRMLCSKVGM